MPTFVKYRSSKKVPARVVGTRKDGKKELMPRKDFRHPGEKLPIVRSADKVYHSSGSVPKNKKSK